MFGIGEILEKRRKRQELKRWKTRITKNFKDLKVRRKLTKEQKNEVQEFYKSLIGRKVDLYSHEYFYSRTGVFTKEYVPTNLYHCELLPKANNRKLSPAYGDKNMCDILFPDENLPKTVLKNMNGYFYYDGKPTKGSRYSIVWAIFSSTARKTLYTEPITGHIGTKDNVLL